MRDRLTGLRSVGVRIAIDDFGTGYSSLGLISRMPFDCMKVDRSLIADLYSDLGATGDYRYNEGFVLVEMHGNDEVLELPVELASDIFLVVVRV